MKPAAVMQGRPCAVDIGAIGTKNVVVLAAASGHDLASVLPPQPGAGAGARDPRCVLETRGDREQGLQHSAVRGDAPGYGCWHSLPVDVYEAPRRSAAIVDALARAGDDGLAVKILTAKLRQYRRRYDARLFMFGDAKGQRIFAAQLG